MFKRVKQNFPLKYFLGDNENAIKIQIWCAFIADLLIKIVQAQLKRKWAFSNLSSIIRLHLMSYINLFMFLNDPDKLLVRPKSNQLKLRGLEIGFNFSGQQWIYSEISHKTLSYLKSQIKDPFHNKVLLILAG